MAVSKGFLLLSMGLCLLSYYHVNSTIKVHGLNPREDVAKRLLELREQKQRLESKMANTSPSSRQFLQMDLQTINSWIRHYETTSKVSYIDYLKTVDEQNKKHEQEQEKLRKQLEKAEQMRTQAMEAFSSSKQRDLSHIESFQKKLKELNAERDRLAEEYATLTQSQYQRQESSYREKMQLIKEREDMKQKLEKAQDLHSRALEAMAAATQEGYKPVSIPHQDEIDKLKKEMKLDTSTSLYGMQLIYGLLGTQAKLEGLLEKLHSESKLSSEATNKDLEEELAKIETDAIRVRDERKNQRQEILQNLKNKGFDGYVEREITSLQNANQRVAETDEALQEIARRSAYLKAIAQVRELINECKNEVRDASIRTRSVTEIGKLPSQPKATPKGLKQSTDSPDQLPNVASTNLTSYEDPETIADIIYQKVLMYKDMHEFYRTRVSTEIVNGLAKVNKRLPIPFPGCNMTRIVEIRDSVGKWADGVQYALRLTKKLNKGGNRSMIARFFVKFLSSIKDAFYTLIGRKKKETNIEDDDELTASIEQFEEQETIDFDEHFNYIKSHLSTLDINAKFSEKKLKDFRYNLISVKKAPEILEETTLRILEERSDQAGENNAKDVEELKKSLRETEIAEKRLQQLFNTLISDIKSAFERKEREYQEALEEYKRCRHGVFRGMPMFSNFPNM